MRTTSHQRFRVTGSSSKKLESNKLQEAFTCRCEDGPSRQEGHAQRQTRRHQRVESFDAGGVPLLWARRGVTVCCAQGRTLCKKKAGCRLFGTDPRRHGCKGRFLECVCRIFVVTLSCPENTCMYRKTHQAQFRQNALTSSGKQKPIWPEVWSFMSKCAQKKRSSSGILKKTKQNTNCTQEGGQVKIFFLTKLKNLTPLFGTLERSWKFQWHQQCLGLHDYASPPPRHRRRTLLCQ